MNKYIGISATVIWVSVTSALAGQATFKSLLLSSLSDPVVLSQDQKVAMAQKSCMGVPGIEDIDLNIRNTGFNSDNFRYSLQVNTRGILESRSARKFNDAIVSNKKTKRMYLLNTAIYNRYLTFIDLLEYNALKILYKDLLTLYDDRIHVMEKLSYSEDFQMERLIKEENDRTKEMVYSLEIDKYISVLMQRAKFFLKDSSFNGFDTTGIVSIKTIMERIESTQFSLDTNNVYLDLYRTRLDVAQTRYNLEKSEVRHFFDNISFSYDNSDRINELKRRDQSKDYDLKNCYQLELGFKIPNLTLSSHDLNRYKADLLSETENYEQIRSELSEKVRKDLADLHQLIKQYRFLSARESEVDAEGSLKKFLQIQGVDPLVLLDIKENIIKNHINMTSIKYGIMRNYLYVIDNAGILSETPLRNYLSEGQEIIEQ